MITSDTAILLQNLAIKVSNCHGTHMEFFIKGDEDAIPYSYLLDINMSIIINPMLIFKYRSESPWVHVYLQKYFIRVCI
jgi:hypothetical protein